MGAFDDLVTPPVAPAAPEAGTSGAFADLIQPPVDPPDELGVGQEIRGFGRAVKRGVAGLGQVVSAMDLIMRQKAIEAATPKVGRDEADWMTGGEPGTVTKVARFVQDSPLARVFRATQEVEKAGAANRMASMERAIQATPQSPDLAGLKDNFWSTFLANPVETVSTVMAESVPQMAPGMLVGMTMGPGGVVAGAGLNSFAVEYANSIMDTARAKGVDLTKPENAMDFFADTKAMDAARQKAVLRGVPVATFDAATAGIAGRFLEPALGKGPREVLKASGKELGMQMAGGAAGEAGGQVASEGRITSGPDIALEALAEIGSAPAEIRGNLRQNAQVAAAQSQATPPPLPPQAPPVIQLDPRRWSGSPDLDSGLTTAQYTLPDRATFRAVAGSDEAGDAQFEQEAETPFDVMVRTAERRRRYVPPMDLSTLGLRDIEADGTSPTTPVDMLMLDARTPQPQKRSSFEIPLIQRPRITVADPMDEEATTAPEPPAAQIELNPRRLALPERTSDPAPDVYDPAAVGRTILEEQEAAKRRREERRALEARATFGTSVGPTTVIHLPEETPDPIHISGRLFRYGVNLNWLNPYPVQTVEGPQGDTQTVSSAVTDAPTQPVPAPAPAAAPLPTSRTEPAAAVAAEVRTPEVLKQSTPPLAPKAQKAFLLSELDRAIKEAPSDEYPEQSASKKDSDVVDIERNKSAFEANRKKFGTVTIEVPGDGTFEIFNTTQSLRAFKEKAKKFPVSQPKPPASGNRSENPTAIPAVGKGTSEDAIRAAAPFVTTDETRPTLMGLWSDGKQTVSTDGRGMLILNRGIGGSEKNPILLTPKGEPVTDSKSEPIPGSTYPNWKQVIPGEGSGAVLAADLDSARLLTVLHQASQGTNEKNKGVVLWRNPDGSVGVNFTAPRLDENSVLEYSHNVQDGAKFVGIYDPKYLIGSLEAMRRMGSDKVTIDFHGHLSPLVIRSKAGKGVIMPMRVNGDSPMPNRQLTVEDLAQPVVAPAPTKSENRPTLREKAAEVMKRKADAIATVKAAAGTGNSTVELTSTTKPNVKLVVHREPTSATDWRVTRFDWDTPTGHDVFKSRSAALAAAAGDSHSKEVGGPAHYGIGEFVVSRVGQPQSKAKVKGDAIEKSGRVEAELTPEQAAVLASLDGAKPGTPQARLKEFLTSGIKAVVKAAVAKFAKGVSGADDYVYARLFREAIAYLEKKGDFKIGIGGYGAQRAADNFAKNAAVAAEGTKAQVSKGSVSVDQPVGEDGATVGDVVAAEALDPAEAAAEADRRQKMEPELKRVIDEVRARFDAVGEGPAFDAALKQVAGIEGGPVTPKDEAKARTPAFQQRVMSEVRAMVEASLGDLSALRSMLYSRINPTGESIGEDAVRSTAEEMIGGPLPENIQLVNLPDELTPDGSRWDARVILGPDGWVIQLNVPHLTSPDQVRSAMLHEAVHVVWEDAKIQREVAALSRAMEGTPGAGTTEEERIEEASVSAVVDQWRSAEAKSAWQRVVSTVWSAVQRVVGIEPPATDRAKSVIAATAIQALKGGRVGVMRNGSGVTAQMDQQYMAAVQAGDMATAQRMVDEAARRAGYTVGPLYHGTTATRSVKGKTTNGNMKARNVLENWAQQFGIASWMDVAGIFERWVQMGTWVEAGIEKSWAKRARELMEVARGSSEPSRQVLGFNEFRVRLGTEEPGIHLGTEQQASTRGEAFPFVVREGRFVRTEDLGTWNYQSVMRALRKAGVPISEEEYTQVFNAQDNNEALRQLLRSKGVDGIVYENQAEGSGDSYMVFDSSQIKSADTVTRDRSGKVIPLSQRFNPDSRDIRFSRSVRYSRWNQAFRSMNEVREALAAPGLTSDQQNALKSSASSAGNLVSPGIRSKLAAMEASPDRVDKAAARSLGFLVKLGEMAGLSPFSFAEDIEARSALEADIFINGRIEGLRRQLQGARERLAKVLADLPLANQKEIEAVMAGSHADQLLRGYREYLDAERKLTGPKGTVVSAKQQALDAAELLLGSIVRDQPASIRTALEAVARMMPTGLPDSAALHAWLVAQEKAGFPAFGGTKPMTDAVWTFMVKGDPNAGVAPAVLNAPAILGKLTDLKSIQNDKARALQVRDRFTNYLSTLTNRVHANVSSDQFAREYAALIQAKQAAADEAASIYDALDRVDVRIRSLIRAIAVAEQAQVEPDYRAGMAQAVRQLDQRFSGIIRFPETTDHRLLGTMQIDGPQSGMAFDFDWAPNPEATRRNIQNAQTLLTEINQYMARPDAEPGRVSVYRDRVIPLLEGKFLADLQTQILGAHDSPRIPLTPHWLFKLPFSAGVSVLKMFSHFFPGNSPRTVVYNMLGGTAGRTMLEYMGRTDLAHNGIRNADANPRTSSVRQKALAIVAAKLHGFISNRYVQFGRQGRTAAESILDWSDMVLNPLFARNQNPGGAPLRVGDWTPTGYRITAADLAAARAQKGYTDAIHRALQRGANSLMQMLPAQTQVDQYFRNAVDYGLKMARGESHWGKSFARRWDVARRADESEAQGLGSPVYRRREALLRDDPRDMNLAVNGWWGTTNPEYWTGYTDKVQMQVANELAADRGNRRTFDSYDAFLDHFAAQREAIINAQAGVAQTTVAAEREAANERFMADMDRATRSVQGGTAAVELPSRDAEGVGDSVANATSAKSSLTNPRGRMVAPDPFYEYTITEDGQRLTFNSQAMLYFQKQELDVLRAVLAALRTERDRLDAEYAQAVPPGNLRGRLLNEWQYRKARNNEIRAGRAITRRNDLTSMIEVLENTAKGIEANMKAGDLDQNRLLQTARAVEAVVSVAKLMSLPVQYANIVAAAFNAPAFNGYAIDQGKLGILGALARGLKAGGYLTRQFGRVFMDLADRAGVGNVVKRNPKAWMGLAAAVHESAMRRRRDIDYLRSAGFAIPESWMQATQRSALGVQLPETGGMVVRDQRLHPIGNPAAGVARLLSIPFQAMAFVGGQATSVGEVIGVQVQNELATSFMESLKPAILRAFEARERSLPDWNDTSKPLAPLLPEELGLGTFKALNEVRRMFANAGQLENLALDWYQRAKAAGSNGLSQPLLTPELERIVRLDMQKQGNIISDSGKADALKKKGWAGLASAIIFRFQQYPIMLTGYINDKLSVDPRDEGAAKLFRQEAATLALLTMLSALAMAGLGGRQWLTEAVTGKVPAASTLTSFSADPTALNFAKMMMAGGANLFLPYWGDQVNKLLSGQSPRPGLDLAAVIPGVGAVAQVMNAVQKMAQTRDAMQPTVDLTRALFPATEAVLNRLPGLREDLVTQNAGRAIRSAAPADVELKSFGGGNSVQTPVSPIIRQAIRAAVAGDRSGFDQAVTRATRVKMDLSGLDEKAARKSVISAVEARDPARLALGKNPTPEEETRITAGMTGSQRAAYQAAKTAFGSIKSWTRKPKAPKVGRRRRQTLGSKIRARRRKSMRPRVSVPVNF